MKKNINNKHNLVFEEILNNIQNIFDKYNHLEILINQSLNEHYDDWENRIFWRNELKKLEKDLNELTDLKFSFEQKKILFQKFPRIDTFSIK